MCVLLQWSLIVASILFLCFSHILSCKHCWVKDASQNGTLTYKFDIMFHDLKKQNKTKKPKHFPLFFTGMFTDATDRTVFRSLYFPKGFHFNTYFPKHLSSFTSFQFIINGFVSLHGAIRRTEVIIRKPFFSESSFSLTGVRHKQNEEWKKKKKVKLNELNHQLSAALLHNDKACLWSAA